MKEFMKISLSIIASTINTISNRELICEKTIEFPWWIMLLVALGEVIIVWWFIPVHKNHKNSKNLKKRA